MTLHLEEIHSRAFNNANSMFYSCNTGTGENSFAQLWENIAEWKRHGHLRENELCKNVYWRIKFDEIVACKKQFFLIWAWNYPIAK